MTIFYVNIVKLASLAVMLYCFVKCAVDCYQAYVWKQYIMGKRPINAKWEEL